MSVPGFCYVALCWLEALLNFPRCVVSCPSAPSGASLTGWPPVRPLTRVIARLLFRDRFSGDRTRLPSLPALRKRPDSNRAYLFRQGRENYKHLTRRRYFLPQVHCSQHLGTCCGALNSSVTCQKLPTPYFDRFQFFALRIVYSCLNLPQCHNRVALVSLKARALHHEGAPSS